MEKSEAALDAIRELIPVVEKISRLHGFIHKRKPARINGVEGFLVWDYIVWNEITFDDMNGNMYSFFSSMSDKKTKKKWKKLVKEYGV